MEVIIIITNAIDTDVIKRILLNIKSSINFEEKEIQTKNNKHSSDKHSRKIIIYIISCKCNCKNDSKHKCIK